MENRLQLDGGGMLRVTVEGARVRLEAEREEDGRGIYKVWVQGGGGGRMLLGTLAPEGGRLSISRSFSRKELEQQVGWPVTGGEAVLAFAFAKEGAWYCEKNPGRLVDDPILRQEMKKPMLCSPGPQGFRLAVPFRTDSPVVLDALVCLAAVELVNGTPHLVWRFDREGHPRIP